VTKAWERFATSCAADVEELTGTPSDPPRVLRIRVADTAGATAAKAEPFLVEVRPADSMEMASHRLLRELLLRRFAPPGDAHPPLLPSTEWLAAALTNRVLYGNRERYGQFLPDYEPARYAFQRGAFPDVSLLVMQPVPAEHTVLYRLYALHCDLLALALTESAGLAAVQRVLELEARGRAPLEAITFIVQDALHVGETLQAWYQRTAVEVSRRGRRPSDTVSSAERFEALVTVPVVAPGERDFRGNRQPLEEVPESLAALRRDRAAVATLQRQLFEIVKDAPFLLQLPMGHYAAALRELPTHSERSTRGALRKARKEFDAALARQRRLDEYLDEQERRHLPTAKRLAFPLEVVGRYARAQRALAPELHRYLDSVLR
jgi:hypothetical protein